MILIVIVSVLLVIIGIAELQYVVDHETIPTTITIRSRRRSYTGVRAVTRSRTKR